LKTLSGHQYTTEIARVGGHYAVEGRSRSPISVLIESSRWRWR